VGLLSSPLVGKKKDILFEKMFQITYVLTVFKQKDKIWEKNNAKKPEKASTSAVVNLVEFTLDLS